MKTERERDRQRERARRFAKKTAESQDQWWSEKLTWDVTLETVE